MTIRWTNEQQQAIGEVQRDVLLTASAGSGKTAVLAQRCVQVLTEAADPCEIDELLVLTFTEAAAAEMRRRIGEALRQRAAAQPEDRRLQRQLFLLDKASISTIHAFCRSLVQEFFYLLDVDPAFEMLDGQEAHFLKLQTAREVMEDVYERLANESGHEDLRRLVDSYDSSAGDQGLSSLVIELCDFLNGLGDRAGWLEQWRKQQEMIARGQIEQLSVMQRQGEVIERELGLVISRLRYAQAIMAHYPEAAMYNDHLEVKLLGPLVEIQQAASGGAGYVAERLKGFSFARLPNRKKDVPAEAVAPVKAQIDRAKKEYQALVEKFGIGADDVLQQLRFTGPLAGELLKLAEMFSERYRKKKRQQQVLDFDDLEVLGLALLRADASGKVNEAVRLLHQRYRYVLVDEYQDVSPIQDALIETICRGEGAAAASAAGRRYGHLFMVGDVKQSIYGFRQADPDIFLAKAQQIKEQGAAGAVQIELNKNFRSTRNILEGVNAIFNRCMQPALGGVDYQTEAQLRYGASYYDDSETGNQQVAIELCLIEKEPTKNDDLSNDDCETLSETQAIEREAMLIGQRIAEMVSEAMEVVDPDTQEVRAVRYSDIVILLRSVKGQVDRWEEVLGRMGIGVYAELSDGFLEAVEIQDMLSLMRLLDNGRQDIALAAVLRSPLVGLADSQLLTIRMQDSDGAFYDAVENYREQGEDAAVRDRLQRFDERLARWREMLRFGTVAELIWDIYRQTHYLAFVRGMEQGRQRQANLLNLHDRACQFEKRSRQGLASFLRYLERMQDEQMDLSPASIQNQADNVVRLMSIHKSKGLEYPVVMVANLDRKFNPMDRSRAVLFNRFRGGSLGMRLVDPVSQDRWVSVEHQLAADDSETRQLAEEMRLLYVAMTRARQRLVLSGSVDLDAARQSWETWRSHREVLLPEFAIRSARCFMDWVGAALACHEDFQDFFDVKSGQGDCFDVKVYDATKVAALCQDPQVEAAIHYAGLEDVVGQADDECAEGVVEDVIARLGWRYPGERLTKLSARASVTDLKHHYQVDPELAEIVIGPEMPEPVKDEQKSIANKNSYEEKWFAKRPNFMDEAAGGIAAADLGSWTHMYLQRLVLQERLDRDELARQLEQMVRDGVFTAAQAGRLQLAQIEDFFNDRMGQDILKYRHDVRREWPFTLAMPAGEVYQDKSLPEATKVIVRGVIDCLYETAAGMVIVDYKTDAVEAEQVTERAACYQAPMQLYGQAVEAIVGKPVARKILYFLTARQRFEIE